MFSTRHLGSPVGGASIALATLVLASSPLGQTATRRSTPAPVHRLVDASAFTGAEVVLDFEAQPPGAMIADYGVVAFASPDEVAAAVWVDGVGGRSAPGAKALHQVSLDPIQHFLHGPRPAETEGLVLRFDRPVSRVGFEVRSLNGREANVILSAHLGTLEFGHAGFDVHGEYGFVGIESARPFRRLEVSFTNPPLSAVSLDNVRFELDDTDTDHDGVPDFADLCLAQFNPFQEDRDGDLRGDACDPFPDDPLDDADGDGFGADVDNCPESYNPDQLDADGDGIGDACDPLPLLIDSDGDGVPDVDDNCPDMSNPDQLDCDGDGIGDVCDPTLIEPAAVGIIMTPGETVTLTKEICLVPSPGLLDLMLVMDTTGSMTAEINLLRQAFESFAFEILNVALPGTEPGDIRIGLAHHEDYVGFFNSCGYANTYGGGLDTPFEVLAPLGTLPAQLFEEIQGLSLGLGRDAPESYSHVLWELAQPDSGVGFREGARRVVVLACDNIPHDCNVNEGTPVGGSLTQGADPGRDEAVLTGDDIDLQDDALQGLVDTDTRLFTIFSGLTAVFPYWQAYSATTGGSAVQIGSNGVIPPDVDIPQMVIDLIEDPIVEQVTFEHADGCGLEITFDPPTLVGPFDTSEGLVLQVTESITLSPGATLPNHACSIDIFADGALIDTQTVDVFLSCDTLDFEGLANGEEIGPGTFAAQGVTLSLPPGANLDNFGACAFDSTPAGPNAGGPDPDLLVDTGNLLILQERHEQSVPGIFDVPDDAQFGGLMVFTFDEPAQVLSIDLVDIEDGPPIQEVTLIQVDASGRTRTTFVPDGWTRDVLRDGAPGYRTLDLLTPSQQPGYLSNAEMIAEDEGFDRTRVVQLRVDMMSSGAIDNLVFCATQ